MRTAVPRVGFDRFIPLEWAATALRVRAGFGMPDDLIALLDRASLGVAARKKTLTVLNRLWLQPRPELADFAERGIAIYRRNQDASVAALTWGMAIAAYPFFGKVAELVGRLSTLHGDCTSAEIHRRMSEAYGEREGTYRMTNAVLQSQVSWGTIERLENGKRITRRKPIIIEDADLTAWLVEAVLRYVDRTLTVTAVSSHAVLYPFALNQPVGYLVTTNRRFQLASAGAENEYVYLYST